MDVVEQTDVDEEVRIQVPSLRLPKEVRFARKGTVDEGTETSTEPHLSILCGPPVVSIPKQGVVPESSNPPRPREG